MFFDSQTIEKILKLLYKNSYKHINIIFFISYFLAMSNSCVNIFIYGAYSVITMIAIFQSLSSKIFIYFKKARFQSEFKLFFKNCPCFGVTKKVYSKKINPKPFETRETLI